MKIPINYSGFEGRDLSLQTAGFFTGPKLCIDGSPAKREKGKYVLRSNDGREIEARVKASIIDPVPKVQIGSETVELARPLRWYEYLWIGLPIVLIFAGGALGAILGILATYASARVFRSGQNMGLNYVLTGLISVSSVIVFFVLAMALQMLIGLQ